MGLSCGCHLHLFLILYLPFFDSATLLCPRPPSLSRFSTNPQLLSPLISSHTFSPFLSPICSSFNYSLSFLHSCLLFVLFILDLLSIAHFSFLSIRCFLSYLFSHVTPVKTTYITALFVIPFVHTYLFDFIATMYFSLLFLLSHSLFCPFLLFHFVYCLYHFFFHYSCSSLTISNQLLYIPYMSLFIPI